MLVIDRLVKTFGTVRAVDGISLTIPQGQMVGVIGRSGAGKSTLLRLINRLADPTSGSITVDGNDITGLKGRALYQWRARCAMIFQQFNLVDRLDVLTNVLVGRVGYQPTIRSTFKIYSEQERAEAIMALDRLGMAEAAAQRAGTLSGGQQQRVAIARALVQRPSLMLADEPVASLDPSNAKLVMDFLRKINAEDGLSVICNLHQLGLARDYCDRLIGIVDGQVVYDGPPSELDAAMVNEIYGAGQAAEQLDDARLTEIGDPAQQEALPVVA